MNGVKTMRDVLIKGVYGRMKEDEGIFFLSDDFGAPMLDGLRKDFPGRFINIGIAEQNLVNVASGLALEGFTVYTYAIAPFYMRAYEQIRINLALSSQLRQVNVNLIGVGAGVSYDVSGPTHHCLEDITIMRALPNLMVFSPSDWGLVESFVDFSINVKKPKYIRLDGKPIERIYGEDKKENFQDGFCELVKGEGVCIVSTGYMTHASLRAAEKTGAGVVDVFMLKPINEALLFDCLKKYRSVVTVEEAFTGKGGMDSLILNVLKKKDSDIKFKSLGFRDEYVYDVGGREYLYRRSGCDEESIIATIKWFKKLKSHGG